MFSLPATSCNSCGSCLPIRFSLICILFSLIVSSSSFYGWIKILHTQLDMYWEFTFNYPGIRVTASTFHTSTEIASLLDSSSKLEITSLKQRQIICHTINTLLNSSILCFPYLSADCIHLWPMPAEFTTSTIIYNTYIATLTWVFIGQQFVINWLVVSV